MTYLDEQLQEPYWPCQLYKVDSHPEVKPGYASEYVQHYQKLINNLVFLQFNNSRGKKENILGTLVSVELADAYTKITYSNSCSSTEYKVIKISIRTASGDKIVKTFTYTSEFTLKLFEEVPIEN